MQVSRGVDTEVSEEELVWGVAKVFGFNIPRARHAKRESGDRRTSFARSYPCADLDSTQLSGYFVSTVGADEETIREFIRRQEQEDRRLDQMSIFEG